MSDEERFYIRHIRESKICMGGARMYFDQRGWDWDEFLTSGRLISDLDNQGDISAIEVAKRAREEIDNGRR